jgi:hypothetical protein
MGLVGLHLGATRATTTPRLFKSFFDVTVQKFDKLYEKALPVWDEQEEDA